MKHQKQKIAILSAEKNREMLHVGVISAAGIQYRLKLLDHLPRFCLGRFELWFHLSKTLSNRNENLGLA